MKWFGEQPTSSNEEKVPVPVGACCAWCEEKFVANESGVVIPHVDDNTVQNLPYHSECSLRFIVGSLGHVLGECQCFGGDMDDPPNMTKRESAKAAIKAFKKLNQQKAIKNATEEFGIDENKLYVVRLYDGMDYEWVDVSVPDTYDNALKLWNEKTENGKKNVKYDDIDYYKIFPL